MHSRTAHSGSSCSPFFGGRERAAGSGLSHAETTDSQQKKWSSSSRPKMASQKTHSAFGQKEKAVSTLHRQEVHLGGYNTSNTAFIRPCHPEQPGPIVSLARAGLENPSHAKCNGACVSSRFPGQLPIIAEPTPPRFGESAPE